MQSKIFSVYKPEGISSFKVVEKVRSVVGVKKVGHGGSLDPLAKGVLVIGIGREATKKLGEEMNKEKEYRAIICLGVKSSTDDREGEKEEVEVERVPKQKEIEKEVEKFVGEIEQVPPKFSAVKVQGKRAYKRARNKESFNIQARKVWVKSIEVMNYEYPWLKLNIITGKGVYIRSLARDIGAGLVGGGYLSQLERTRVGEFSKKRAIPFSELEKYLDNY